MESTTQGSAVAQLHGYHGELILFQEIDQHGLISVHDHGVRIHYQHI
jgi:hypothetical protein